MSSEEYENLISMVHSNHKHKNKKLSANISMSLSLNIYIRVTKRVQCAKELK